MIKVEGLGGVLVVCGECYNKLIGMFFYSVPPIMFLKTPKIRGMTSLAL